VIICSFTFGTFWSDGATSGAWGDVASGEMRDLLGERGLAEKRGGFALQRWPQDWMARWMRELAAI
jgi:hypothetical protein